MANVIQVNFDSYWNLARPSYVFKFRGREYRALRGKGNRSNREKDCILSILADYNKEYDEVEREIMIYCGCLSWEYETPVRVGGGGGYGTSKVITIKDIRRVDVTKRTMPVGMYSLSLHRIPYVDSKDQEDAIGLYREAVASESPFYKFLCLWNILNIPRKEYKAVIGWINNTAKTRKSKIFPNNFINGLEKKGVNIGNYLYEECRNAIAHIRRNSSERIHIDPNNGRDFSRIATSARFLEDLVKIYAKEGLLLKKVHFLYRIKPKDIPEYLTEEEIEIKLYGKVLNK